MFKIELWGRTVEVLTKEYRFKTMYRTIKDPSGKKGGWLSSDVDVLQLGVILFDENQKPFTVESYYVDTYNQFDDLLAYVKTQIDQAIEVKPLDYNIMDWIKTPERLLRRDKIDHIRRMSEEEGGGTLFVHVDGTGLYEPKLEYEEACRLLGYNPSN